VSVEGVLGHSDEGIGLELTAAVFVAAGEETQLVGSGIEGLFEDVTICGGELGGDTTRRVVEVIGDGDAAEAIVAFLGKGEKRLLLAWAPLEKA
jgi:hypothetical protein